MRISSFVVSLSLLTVLTLPALAQAQAPVEPGAAGFPAFILEGLHQLALQNPDGAERAWATGTSAEPDARALRSLLADSGAYQNFDVVKVQDLAPHLRVIYLALNFERQPSIVKFLLYRTANGWILIDHRFNIDERIFESIAQPAGQ